MPLPLGTNSDQNNLNNPTSCGTTHPNCILMNPKTHNDPKTRNGSLPNIQSSCSKAAEITNGTSSGSSSKAATASRLLFNSFCSKKPTNNSKTNGSDESKVPSKSLVSKTISDASNETDSSCINEESVSAIGSGRDGSSSLNRRKTSNNSIKKTGTS